MSDNRFGVAVKAIIKNKDDKYLVMHKSNKEDINPNEVDIPGGRIKFGENVTDALIREVEEETGLKIAIKKPTRVWGFVKNNLHLVGITFLADLVDGKVTMSDEHSGFSWVDKKDLFRDNFPEWIKDEFSSI